MYLCLSVVTFHSESKLTYVVNIFKVKVCNFPGAVIKDIATFALFSWIAHPGESQMPCREATQRYREGTQMEKS